MLSCSCKTSYEPRLPPQWQHLLEGSITEAELHLRSTELQTAILIGQHERPVSSTGHTAFSEENRRKQMNENAAVMATSYHQKSG